MTPTQQRGYDDAKAGLTNPALAEADTPAGREYRAGVRQRRRDESDAQSDGVTLGAGWVPTYDNPDNRHCEQPAESVVTGAPRLQIEPEPPCAAPNPFAAIQKAGPFADPEPRAPRTRKAKPVDDAQASLF